MKWTWGWKNAGESSPWTNKLIEVRFMSRKRSLDILKRSFLAMVALMVLASCATEDRPFTLVSDTNAPDPGVEGGDPSVSPGGPEGCIVNFIGTMQLKVSADPTGSAPTEVLDANPIEIDPIPFVVDGNNLVLSGDTFPNIILTKLSESADLRVSGIPGSTASGPFDPGTGSIEIPGFQFSLEILNKGTTDRFIDGFETLTGIDFTTGSVTATGNLNDISEDGSPLDSSTGAVTLVLGTTLPNSFPALSVLDTMIAGGALTARFEGALDQLPQDCVDGGGSGGTPGGAGGPTSFSISDGSSSNTGSIDFGTAQVLTTKVADKTILDCTDALNRSPIAKLITLKNTGSGERKIKVMNPADTDGDAKDPLCSGSAEFVRGSIKPHGAATCDTVSVGGKTFDTTECTIPEGDDESYLTFPLIYTPYNFVEVAEGEEAQPDQGILAIEYDDAQVFNLQLTGRSEKDSKDSFRISKVKDDVISSKELQNNDVVKINLSNDDPKPFTQTLALKNLGTDVWEDVTITVQGEESVYSVEALSDTTLPASGDAGPGILQFNLVFNPGSGQVFNDRLQISLVRAGSVTSENPQGSVSIINLDLSGTVGIPALTGNVKFQIDFLAGKIDHPITTNPVESLDFRMHPDQAPPPLDLIFVDTDEESVKTVTLDVENKSVVDKSLEERMTSLRILNAQATYGTPGRKLVPGEGADLCNEPPNINIAYEDSRMECSYFYFGISGDTPGLYDDEEGELSLPEITLRIENPYHSDIAANWLPSNPAGSPSNILDTTLEITLTTLLIDDLEAGDEETGIINLVPDDRILKSDLSVKGKPMGEECPEDIFNHDPSTGTLDEKHPHIRCYLTSDERFLKGRAISIRPDDINERDIVIVGVGRYPPDTLDPNLPWFMGENGGSLMYVAIQGRLIVE